MSSLPPPPPPGGPPPPPSVPLPPPPGGGPLPPPVPGAASSAGGVYRFGPQARELFVATFTILMRSWKPAAIVSILSFIGQGLFWAFVAVGLDDVFGGDFREAVDRALSIGSATGGTLSDDDIDFFESIEFGFSAQAAIWFAVALAVFMATYVTTQIAWLRVFMAGRNDIPNPPARALTTALTLLPRVVISGLIVALPLLLAIAGSVLLVVAEPLLMLLVALPLLVVGVIWLLLGSVTLATASLSPKRTPVIRTAFGLVRSQPAHAVKCLIMAILPAMVVGFAGGALGQLGLLFGVWGYLVFSTVSGIIQAAVQTAGLTAVYLSLGGPIDPRLEPSA